MNDPLIFDGETQPPLWTDRHPRVVNGHVVVNIGMRWVVIAPDESRREFATEEQAVAVALEAPAGRAGFGDAP